MKKQFFLLLIAAFFVASCGGDDEESVPELIPPPDVNEINNEHENDHNEDPVPGSPEDLEDGVAEVRLPEEASGAAGEHPADVWFQVIYNAIEANGDVQAAYQVLEKVPSDVPEPERQQALNYIESYVKASTTGEGADQFPTVQPDTDSPSGLLYPGISATIDTMNVATARFPDERYVYEGVVIYRYMDHNNVEHGPYLLHIGLASEDGKLEMLSADYSPLR